MSTATEALTSGDILGFESPSGWSTTTAGAVLSSSTQHDQGAFSLEVKPSPSNGYTPLKSVQLSTLGQVSLQVSPTLAVDVMLPTQEPNPNWLGTAQVYLNCPSRNVFNVFLAQVELTGKPLNTWNTLNFPLTNATVSSLLNAGYNDLTVTVVLNVPVPTTGLYHVDNLRFVPLPANGCGGRPNNTLCTDNNACTQSDHCQNGACTGAAVTCQATDQCHSAGTCNPTTGACSNPPKANGATCDDGNACTQTDSCQNGACTGTNPRGCIAVDQCHAAGVCDPGTGQCSNPVLADATSCTDADPCTTMDQCEAGVCTGLSGSCASPMENVTLVASLVSGTGTAFDGVASMAAGEFLIPAELQVTSGNAGNGSALLTILEGESSVQCHYLGGASLAHPTTALEIALGQHYVFSSCDNGSVSGDPLFSTGFQLHLLGGDSLSNGGLTTILAILARLHSENAQASTLSALYDTLNRADFTYQLGKEAVIEADRDAFFDSSEAAQAKAATARTLRGAELTAAIAAAQALGNYTATLPVNSGSSDTIVESALLSFIGDFRLSLGRLPASQRFNDSCPDFVTSDLLFNLAQGIFDNDRGRYAAALGTAEAALDCGPFSQAMGFNEALASAFDKALSRFTPDARPTARRGLMSALMNLFLLVHDDTKSAGPTPLYQWFSNNRVALGEVLAEPNSGPRLIGLWLRHPSSDALVQIQKLCEDPASGSGCVSGGALLDALTDPWRIGVGGCTALEVVSAGLDPDAGYFCDRGLCSIQDGTLVPAPSGASPLLMRLFANNGGQTQFGVDLPTLQAARCQGAPSRVGGMAGGGMVGGGVSGSSNEFACLTSGIIANGASRITQCEIDGALANATTQNGDRRRGWAGDSCMHAKSDDGDNPDGGDPGDGSTGVNGTEPGCTENCGDTPASDTQTPTQKSDVDNALGDVLYPQFRADLAAAAAAAGYGTLTDEIWNAALNDLINAEFVPQDVIDEGAEPGTFGTEVFVDGEGTIFVSTDAGPQTTLNTLEHEFVHDVLDRMNAAQGAEPGENETDNQHQIICGGTLGILGCECGEEQDNCGSCSAASSVIDDILSCSGTTSGLSPITNGGGVIDPSPIGDPESSLWSGCFTNGLPTIPTACLALDCSDQDNPVLVNGHCQCNAPSGPAMPPIATCGALDCPEGPPIVTAAGCMCTPFGGPSMGGLPIPGCTLCVRPAEPTLTACLGQPQACFFQDP
ncbi:MAG TPA: hypothetical protein VMI54_19645 [Polyangiaceae bacterium]|nr:hypothetical protein [Polyangiaceae bacterium]